MSKRKVQISDDLSVVEALWLNSPEMFESWHGQFIRTCRRHFDSNDDLSESEFETLQKLRHKVAPPALGKSSTPISEQMKTSPGTKFIDPTKCSFKEYLEWKEANMWNFKVPSPEAVRYQEQLYEMERQSGIKTYVS